MSFIVWLALIVVLVLASLGAIGRYADGPLGPIPGGPLRDGPLVKELELDESFARVVLVELQLVEPLGSRTTGTLVHEGELYVPCDLGFIWRRVTPPARWLMHLVWHFKRWHEDVLRDERVVLRIRGKRYERQAVRVTDPALLGTLRDKVEAQAAAFLPTPLADTPPDLDAIWFFRMDPRPPT